MEPLGHDIGVLGGLQVIIAILGFRVISYKGLGFGAGGYSGHERVSQTLLQSPQDLGA